MKKKSLFASMLPIYLVALCCLLLIGAAGDRFITVMTESAPLDNRKCIVIDAGHGGEDGGATSCTGVYESSINLEIAMRLDDLMHLLGIETIMIRTSDRSVYTSGNTIAAKKMSDLKERVRIINEAEDAILLSIHQNHFSDGKYHGAQVFYAETEGSELLAKNLQAGLIQALNKDSKRMAKKAESVYLMKHIDRTGVLVECGFLSNPEEEAKLRSDAYQKKLCCVIGSVCSRYLENADIA